MQVRKRPLNRKEMAKKEDDIITIERNSNALTVHETKFKVSSINYISTWYHQINTIVDCIWEYSVFLFHVNFL